MQDYDYKRLNYGHFENKIMNLSTGDLASFAVF